MLEFFNILMLTFTLKGKYVRVEIEGWGGKILRIGHLMKDKWFSFKDYFDEVKALNELKEE